MSQPDPYKREFGFTDFQTAHPKTPLPGNKLDSELDTIGSVTEELAERIRILQRDDLELANNIVGFDQLKNEAKLRFAPPVLWETGKAYAKNDVVYNGQLVYICLVAHTSSVFANDLVAVRWQLVANFEGSAPTASSIAFTQAGSGASVSNVEAKLRGWVSVSDFGAAFNGTTDDRAALANANSRAVLVNKPLYVDTSLTANRTLRVASDITLTADLVFVGGILKPDAGVTITLSGALDAGPRRIFDVSLGGTIAGSPVLVRGVVHGEWWGANPYSVGVNSAPFFQNAVDFLTQRSVSGGGARGGVIELRHGWYGWGTQVTVNSRGIRFVGQGPMATTIYKTAQINALVFTGQPGNTGAATGCGVKGIQFYSAASQPTAGRDILFDECVQFFVDDCYFYDTYIGIDMTACQGSYIKWITNNTWLSTPLPAPAGSFVVTGGSASSANQITAITVNGVNLISSAVTHTGDNATTAAAIAAQINSTTSAPDYIATSSGATVNISGLFRITSDPATQVNGLPIGRTVTGDFTTGSAVAMAGGVAVAPGSACMMLRGKTSPRQGGTGLTERTYILNNTGTNIDVDFGMYIDGADTIHATGNHFAGQATATLYIVSTLFNIYNLHSAQNCWEGLHPYSQYGVFIANNNPNPNALMGSMMFVNDQVLNGKLAAVQIGGTGIVGSVGFSNCDIIQAQADGLRFINGKHLSFKDSRIVDANRNAIHTNANYILIGDGTSAPDDVQIMGNQMGQDYFATTVGTGINILSGTRVLVTNNTIEDAVVSITNAIGSNARIANNITDASETRASASVIDLALGVDTFYITGTTKVNTILAASASKDRVVRLRNASGLTYGHNTSGTGNLRLAGGTDATLNAGSWLTLMWDGANSVWVEVSRMAA